MGSETVMWVTAGVFAATYAGLAVGKVPGLRVDRAAIALVGAVLMLATGALTLAQAAGPESVDYDTLCLLFGMMVIVGCLRTAGFFAAATRAVLGRVRTARGLLAATVVLSGVLSAFLVNDIVCLALTPLVLAVARRLGHRPVPHLIGLATAANVGSVATLTGNPQNMIIGPGPGSGTWRSPAGSPRSPPSGCSSATPSSPWSTAATCRPRPKAEGEKAEAVAHPRAAAGPAGRPPSRSRRRGSTAGCSARAWR